MWTRTEVKEQGRQSMRLNYWPSVGAGLLLTIATGGGVANSGPRLFKQFHGSGEQVEHIQNIEHVDQAGFILIVIAVLIAIAFVLITSSAFRFLLLNPLQVGCRHFFRENLPAPANINGVLYGFQNGYGRNLLAMLLADVFSFLWGLLLIVPGIIKRYSYRLVPYILEDEPGLSPTEVITRSRQMMDGQKMNAFILDLSFIGWALLTFVTLGLAGVFYVLPYKAGTDAALYEAIKAEQYS